jgi:hypothetical protein
MQSDDGDKEALELSRRLEGLFREARASSNDHCTPRMTDIIKGVMPDPALGMARPFGLVAFFISTGDEEDSEGEDSPGPPSPDEKDEGIAHYVSYSDRIPWNSTGSLSAIQENHLPTNIVRKKTTAGDDDEEEDPPSPAPRKTHEDFVNERLSLWTPLWTKDTDIQYPVVDSSGDVALLGWIRRDRKFVIFKNDGREIEIALEGRIMFSSFESRERGWSLKGFMMGPFSDDHEYRMTVDPDGRAGDACPSATQFAFSPSNFLVRENWSTSPCGEFAVLWARDKVTLFRKDEPCDEMEID